MFKIFAGASVLTIVVLLVLDFFLGGIALHYDLEFWASYAKGHAVIVPFLPCLLVGLVPQVAGLAIVVALVTWVLSFVL